MHELISVTLTGHSAAFPLSQDAHAALRGYLGEARIRLQSDPDREEVLRDLETAIGDRLVSRSAAADAPIGAEDMRRVLDAVGRVGGENDAQPVSRGVPRGRFFCRITEGKWFGGICLGLAAYGSFRVDWVRTIVFLLTLVTGGLLGIVYLILLIPLPVVPTVAEYERLRDSPRDSTA